MRIFIAMLKATGVLVCVALVLWFLCFVIEHFGPVPIYIGMIMLPVFGYLTTSFLND